MEINLISYAVPVFFLCIIIEALYSFFKKRALYRVNDAINSLSCGVMEQVIEIFLKFILVFQYKYIYDNFRIFEVNHSWIAWVLCFFSLDLVYYLFHRTAHEVTLVWGSHNPHHQSEEYNLTTALRQGTFQGLFSNFFYVTLALIGFDTVMVLICLQLNLIYQFFIHTRTVKKLGFLELFMNTPSHHRVHHGKNEKYLDKNYAGVFIIWDRIFGTFEEEDEEVVYGTLSPIKSLNPFWNNLVYWYELYQLSTKLNSLKDKLGLFFKPLWLKDNYAKLHINMEEYFKSDDFKSKFNPKISNKLTSYSLVHFIFILAFSVPLLDYKGSLLDPYIIANVSLVVFSLSSMGWLLESNKNSLKLEQVRLFLVIIYTLIAPFSLFMKEFIIVTYVLSLLFLNMVKKEAIS